MTTCHYFTLLFAFLEPVQYCHLLLMLETARSHNSFIPYLHADCQDFLCPDNPSLHLSLYLNVAFVLGSHHSNELVTVCQLFNIVIINLHCSSSLNFPSHCSSLYLFFIWAGFPSQAAFWSVFWCHSVMLPLWLYSSAS